MVGAEVDVGVSVLGGLDAFTDTGDRVGAGEIVGCLVVIASVGTGDGAVVEAKAAGAGAVVGATALGIGTLDAPPPVPNTIPRIRESISKLAPTMTSTRQPLDLKDVPFLSRTLLPSLSGIYYSRVISTRVVYNTVGVYVYKIRLRPPLMPSNQANWYEVSSLVAFSARLNRLSSVR